MDYTLADIMRISGAKRRSIQLWAEAGVIRAYTSTERKGTGTHRRFNRDEVIIASIINVFSTRQVAIGELQRLAGGLRRFIAYGRNRQRIENAISEYEPWYLIIVWRTDRMPDVDICELDTVEATLQDTLYHHPEHKFELSVVLSLYSCLSRLDELK
jgi:DNA-binding transcriptional MerR regulator